MKEREFSATTDGLSSFKRSYHEEAKQWSATGGGIFRDPARSVDRRRFLKLTGLGSMGLIAMRQPVMAGPFSPADFEKLVPSDKRLGAGWIKSLFDRGEPTFYQGENLKWIGMPIGGLCAGQLYLGGDGRLWHWDISIKRSTPAPRARIMPLPCRRSHR